ncbi:RNA polymerase [Bacteroidia bacterium]|nr:RNA polymerase [Bacteroidia bacterium]
MTQKQEDEKMWNDFRAGDNQAYAVIYRRYVKQLLAYGMRFSADRELVKDCVQNVFVHIYENRSRLKETDNVKLFLFITLKNSLFRLFEKEKEFSRIDTLEPVFSVDYSTEDQLKEEKEEKVLRIFEALTPRQKEVIYYRYMEEMDFDKIGKIMQMNYQSIQNLIQRSINKARKAFPDKLRTKS